MSTTNGMSYSAALGQGAASQTVSKPSQSRQYNTKEPPKREPKNPESSRPKRRTPSPSQQPRLESEEENVYVLTLLTDKPLHERMTALRKQYFPKWNKLAAHLTLFHALPESKLESKIIPVIQDVVNKTAPFKIQASELFRLKNGFAISVSKSVGGSKAQNIHRALQSPWKEEGWLSVQDAGGCRLHYTLMNKVDDEKEIQKGYEEISGSWKEDEGMAEGLGLWRYDRGYWRRERAFNFRGGGQNVGAK